MSSLPVSRISILYESYRHYLWVYLHYLCYVLSLSVSHAIITLGDLHQRWGMSSLPVSRIFIPCESYSLSVIPIIITRESFFIFCESYRHYLWVISSSRVIHHHPWGMSSLPISHFSYSSPMIAIIVIRKSCHHYSWGSVSVVRHVIITRHWYFYPLWDISSPKDSLCSFKRWKNAWHRI